MLLIGSRSHVGSNKGGHLLLLTHYSTPMQSPLAPAHFQTKTERTGATEGLGGCILAPISADMCASFGADTRQKCAPIGAAISAPICAALRRRSALPFGADLRRFSAPICADFRRRSAPISGANTTWIGAQIPNSDRRRSAPIGKPFANQ